MNHKDSFLDIHSALTGGSQGEQPEAQLEAQPQQPEASQDDAPEQSVQMIDNPQGAPEEVAPEQELADPSGAAIPQDGMPEGQPEEMPAEEGTEEQPEEGAEGVGESGDLEQDQEELIAALKEMGHSDSEIAHIVHGHSLSHAVEHLKEKIQEDFKALKEHQNLDHQGKMSEIELAHKQRMLDMEAQSQDPGHNAKIRDLELEHKKRMLDLEHKHAERMKDLEFDMKRKKASESKND